jgi:hypothetical protein
MRTRWCSQAGAWLLVATACAACGGKSDSGGPPSETSEGGATDANAAPPMDGGGVDHPLDGATGNDAAAGNDAMSSPGDATSPLDAGAGVDATRDGPGPGVPEAGGNDASVDGSCTPVSGSTFSCSGACDTATSYCVGGGVPQMCRPIPAGCECAETHTCACLLGAITSPCTGGRLTCAATSATGELFVTASGCQ